MIKRVMKFVKNLLNRLRGKPKSARKKILQRYNQDVKIYTPLDFSVEEDIPAPPSKETYSDKAINIKNTSDLEKLLIKLNNLNDFEEFQRKTPLQWVNVQLDRVRDVIKKLTLPQNFEDEELNFNVAKKVREISEIMLEIFQNSNSPTQLDEDSRSNLKNLVENYLKNVGVEKTIFNPGELYDDWASLNMQNSYQIISTNKRDLHGRIAEVEVQPHVIYYFGDTGDVERLIFGGICKAYKFKEV